MQIKKKDLKKLRLWVFEEPKQVAHI